MPIYYTLVTDFKYEFMEGWGCNSLPKKWYKTLESAKEDCNADPECQCIEGCNREGGFYVHLPPENRASPATTPSFEGDCAYEKQGKTAFVQ